MHVTLIFTRALYTSSKLLYAELMHRISKVMYEDPFASPYMQQKGGCHPMYPYILSHTFEIKPEGNNS
jgi:hypothetical protein